MKELLVLLLVDLLAMPLYATSICTKTDLECYVTGPTANLTTQWRIDASGNATSNGVITSSGTGTSNFAGSISVAGNGTTSGITVYPPQVVVGITTITVISPTSTYLQVLSTGAVVTCGIATPMLPGNAAIPCISTATATNGQLLILTSTSTINTLIMSSGTSAGMDLGAATRTLQFGKVLTLIYDSSIFEWKELSYGNN